MAAPAAYLACLLLLAAASVQLPTADAGMDARMDGSRRRLLKAKATKKPTYAPGHSNRDPVNCKVLKVAGVKVHTATRTSDCGLNKGNKFYVLSDPNHHITLQLSVEAGGPPKYDSGDIKLIGARDRTYDTRYTDATLKTLDTRPYALFKISGRKNTKSAKTHKTTTVYTVVWRPLGTSKTLNCVFQNLCGCQGRMEFVFKDTKLAPNQGGICAILWPPTNGTVFENFFFSIPAKVHL